MELNHLLPIIFAGLMGLSVLIYVVLDGYDLGIGILMGQATDDEKNIMIASISPFWDANETWLVMSVGILLVAFPIAHGVILTSLYIPTAIMLGGLILRGVSFDFRAKAKAHHKHLWDKLFMLGSIVASFTQGYMLGIYILGFQNNMFAMLFGFLVGVCLIAGYAFIGAAWLIMKTEGALQKKAVQWARYALGGVLLGMVLVSAATPMMSERIFAKWFTLPNFFFLLPIPIITGCIIMALAIILRKLPMPSDRYCWVPFVGAVALFVLGFQGLAYSFFPYIVPEQLTIDQAASSTESLEVILAGVVIVLPCILGYTAFAYRVFWGKAKTLTY